MFVKLFGSILDSSIWSTDLATRVVWITMLAMADENGIVSASVSGLARRACVSEPACRKALRVLGAPDAESRTKNQEGRRIEEVDGGWLLLNYSKYRELRSKKQVIDATRQARHRQAKSVTQRDSAVTLCDSGHITVEAEAEAEAEEEGEGEGDLLGACQTAWEKHQGLLNRDKCQTKLLPLVRQYGGLSVRIVEYYVTHPELDKPSFRSLDRLVAQAAAIVTLMQNDPAHGMDAWVAGGANA